MRFNVLAPFLLTALLVCAMLSAGQPRKAGGNDPRTLDGQLKPTESRYYMIYTDVDADSAKEAVIRMTKMAEEYHDRTSKLFRGQINKKLPFYLYANGADYNRAGGMTGTAGVFNGEALMAMAIPARRGGVGGAVGPETWHVVQHEGFHQFVRSVIRGDIPIWVNEGLAEYFGEGIFTGDGMITGVIPPERLARVQARFKLSGANGFPSIKTMMAMSHDEWNRAMQTGQNAKAGANYDMGWTMVHFLAHAENGKYQDTFANFLVLVGNGRSWEQAWQKSFGSVEGFEEKWKTYWTELPENPTADLYAQAAVSTMTAFAARAATQKQVFESFDTLLATDPKDLKYNPADWLPPSLFASTRDSVSKLRGQGCVFTLVQPKGSSPSIQCATADGAKFTGTCSTSGGRAGKVNVDITKASAPKPTPAKPSAPQPPVAKPK
jgi:hypothetical protein